MVYTSISKVQEYLRTTFSTVTTPTLAEVTSIISSIDDEVDKAIGTTYTLTETSQIFNLPYSTNELLVEKLPLNSVTSIYKNVNTPYDPEFTEEITAYYTDNNLILLQYNLNGEQCAEVTYKYGFDGPTNDVVRLATLMVAKQILGSEDSANNQFTRTRIGPIDTTRSIGASRFVNIQNDIDALIKKIGSFKKVYK